MGNSPQNAVIDKEIAADQPTTLTPRRVQQYFKNYGEVNNHDRDDLCHSYIFDKEGADKVDYEEMVGLLEKVLGEDVKDQKLFLKGTEKTDGVYPALFVDVTYDKALGSFLGMLLGDALGAPFEFSAYRTGVAEMKDGFSEVELWQHDRYNRFQLKPGQWTDDASMGLCLADSLISCQGYDGVDLRFRFHRWWTNGYCNAFGWDTQRKRQSHHGSHSVGLGGNISLSMNEFAHYKTGTPLPKTRKGDKNTSGNGSVMRNAAVPIYYHKDIQAALFFADEQSKSTHQGDEAGECCQVMTFLIVTSIQKPELKKSELLALLDNFKVVVKEDNQFKYQDPLKTVIELCQSKGEWNWKDEQFKYQKNRAESQPGYVGSYAMDALAMSLHCVHTTESFTDCMLKCANLRGDSDSVSSVAGQIAGAIYGFHSIPRNWIYAILQWDRDMFNILRPYKLVKHAPEKIDPMDIQQDVPTPGEQHNAPSKGDDPSAPSKGDDPSAPAKGDDPSAPAKGDDPSAPASKGDDPSAPANTNE